MKFTIEAVCISKKKGTCKQPVRSVRVIKDFGIENDAHAGCTSRQISILAAEAIEMMKAEGLVLKPGAFGENLITRGLDWSKIQVGGKITIGDVVLEVTQIGKECHSPCSIFYTVGRCIMPETGIFLKVSEGGRIHVNHSGHYCI